MTRIMIVDEDGKKHYYKSINHPTVEPVAIGRKRASFDIRTDLLKELRLLAATSEENIYELVEEAIELFIKSRKNDKI